MVSPVPGQFTTITVDGNQVPSHSQVNESVHTFSPTSGICVASNSLPGNQGASNAPWLRMVFWQNVPGASTFIDDAATNRETRMRLRNVHTGLWQGGVAVPIVYDIGLCGGQGFHRGIPDACKAQLPSLIAHHLQGPLSDFSTTSDFRCRFDGYAMNGIQHYNRSTNMFEPKAGSSTLTGSTTMKDWGSSAYGTPFDPAQHPFFSVVDGLSVLANSLATGGDPNIRTDNFSVEPMIDHWSLEYYVPLTDTFFVGSVLAELNEGPDPNPVNLRHSRDSDGADNCGLVDSSLVDGMYGFFICMKTDIEVVCIDGHSLISMNRRYLFPEDTSTTFTGSSVIRTEDQFLLLIQPRHYLGDNTEFSRVMHNTIYNIYWSPISLTSEPIITSYVPSVFGDFVFSPRADIIASMRSIGGVTGKRYGANLSGTDIKSGTVGTQDYNRGFTSRKAITVTHSAGSVGIGGELGIQHFGGPGESYGISSTNFGAVSNTGAFGTLMQGQYFRTIVHFVEDGGSYNVS